MCSALWHSAHAADPAYSRDWEARGLATGIASHGIGTAQMLSIDETAGAFAGLAIGLTGLFTAVMLPCAAYLLQS